MPSENETAKQEQVALSIEQILMANTLTIFQNLIDGLIKKSGHEPVIKKLNPQQLNLAFRAFANLGDDDEALDVLKALRNIAPEVFPSANKGKFCYLRVPFEAAQQMTRSFKQVPTEEGEKILHPLKKKAN